jgi:hypothetical protein
MVQRKGLGDRHRRTLEDRQGVFSDPGTRSKRVLNGLLEDGDRTDEDMLPQTTRKHGTQRRELVGGLACDK